MVSKSILIAVVIGVFFAGIGVSYAYFANTYDPMSMKFQNQELFDQMMSNNPKMSQMWINSGMMNESQMQEQMMNMMKQNPQQMQQMIMNNMHDSDQMTMMEDMTADMVKRMQNDPELKQAMMEHMDRMKASRESMMGTVDTDSSMMDDTMTSSVMSFNPDVPITIPMIDGYYNGDKVYFIHTELSDEKMADVMTRMVNFPTLYTPDLENISVDDIGKFYVFTNGIAGTGRYGGGPFFYQIDLFDTIPTSNGYSEFRVPQLVTWNEDSTPRLLTSVSELLDAKANGELSIKSADFVVHLPMILWDSDMAEEIKKPFVTMPQFDAKVINIDENNYTVTLQFYPADSMDMMN